MLPEVSAAQDDPASWSRRGIVRVNRELGRSRPLMSDFKKMLNVLLQKLTDQQATFRAKVVKALAAIVKEDPETLGDQNFYLFCFFVLFCLFLFLCFVFERFKTGFNNVG